jgi:hypothetical protein
VDDGGKGNASWFLEVTESSGKGVIKSLSQTWCLDGIQRKRANASLPFQCDPSHTTFAARSLDEEKSDSAE